MSYIKKLYSTSFAIVSPKKKKKKKKIKKKKEKKKKKRKEKKRTSFAINFEGILVCNMCSCLVLGWINLCCLVLN